MNERQESEFGNRSSLFAFYSSLSSASGFRLLSQHSRQGPLPSHHQASVKPTTRRSIAHFFYNVSFLKVSLGSDHSTVFYQS